MEFPTHRDQTDTKGFTQQISCLFACFLIILSACPLQSTVTTYAYFVIFSHFGHADIKTFNSFKGVDAMTGHFCLPLFTKKNPIKITFKSLQFSLKSASWFCLILILGDLLLLLVFAGTWSCDTFRQPFATFSF